MDEITYKYLINIPTNKNTFIIRMHLNFITQRIINKEILYGLDKKLFQKLNNYIETIKEDYYEKLLHHKTNKLKLIDNHKINENNIDNTNKLNLSITLIIENNKKNREEIEEEKEEENYNNNYTNNIEINYNYSLFQKVWDNLQLKERKFEMKKNHQKGIDNDEDEPLEKFPQSNIRSLYLNEEYDLFYKKMIPCECTSSDDIH
ncbi:hypothetical protein ACTFIW_003420 [Dictyostelium discoideum]